MICKGCGLEHPGWIGCLKAKYEAAKSKRNDSPPASSAVRDTLDKATAGGVPALIDVLTAPQSDPVLTTACVNGSVNRDRHRPGYMRDYMRKRRASV
jgi:hypothetical protein